MYLFIDLYSVHFNLAEKKHAYYQEYHNHISLINPRDRERKMHSTQRAPRQRKYKYSKASTYLFLTDMFAV